MDMVGTWEILGEGVGSSEGDEDGRFEGLVDTEGANDGRIEGNTEKVGCTDGLSEGAEETVGTDDGSFEGSWVGETEGNNEVEGPADNEGAAEESIGGARKKSAFPFFFPTFPFLVCFGLLPTFPPWYGPGQK